MWGFDTLLAGEEGFAFWVKWKIDAIDGRRGDVWVSEGLVLEGELARMTGGGVSPGSRPVLLIMGRP
jgi:hypothetical protein